MTRGKLKLAAIYVSFLLCGSVAAMLLFFSQIFNQAEFLPGVKIAGLSVQGLNTSEAAAAVQKLLDKKGATEITFYKDDYIYKTKLGNLCEPADVPVLIKNILNQEYQRSWTSKVMNLDGSQEIAYPVNIKYNTKAIDNMITEWSKYVEVECKNARLEIDRQKGLVVIPGQKGKLIARDPTLSQMPQKWEDVQQSLKILISLKDKTPLVDEKSLISMGQLSEFSTWFNPQEVNRSHNLATAVAAINASAVAPDEVFSYNNTVGEITAAKGYRDANVIVNGKFEPGLGGGVCQVSSTLYNACLLAGLNIVERHNHALSVAYVPLGLDATVANGSQDFRFKNNTGFPIYIRALVSGGKLTINIYGYLAFKQKIGLNSVVDQVRDFKTVEVLDTALQPGTQKVENNGMPGYMVRSFRTFYDLNGREVRKEQLARDIYQPLNKLVYVGPPVTQPPVTPPVSEPNPIPVESPPPDDSNQPPATSPDGVITQ